MADRLLAVEHVSTRLCSAFFTASFASGGSRARRRPLPPFEGPPPLVPSQGREHFGMEEAGEDEARRDGTRWDDECPFAENKLTQGKVHARLGGGSRENTVQRMDGAGKNKAVEPRCHALARSRSERGTCKANPRRIFVVGPAWRVASRQSQGNHVGQRGVMETEQSNSKGKPK